MVDKIPSPAKGLVAKPVRTFTKTTKCGERSFPMSSPTRREDYLITSDCEEHGLLLRSPKCPAPVAVNTPTPDGTKCDGTRHSVYISPEVDELKKLHDGLK